jgi:superfamily II DNA or RNA helicase
MLMDQVEIFQKDIYKKYKKYKIGSKKPTFKQICFPDKYTFQMPQSFVGNYIHPTTKYKGLLLYHKIGAGKTCAAIKIAEQWKHKRNIIMTCPASLVGNFYKEIRSLCTGSEYMTEIDREELKSLDVGSKDYKTIIKSVNNEIDKYYQIYSYNKLVELIENKKLKLDNAILIIDEVQNIVSEHGSYYKTILTAIQKAPSDLRVVIMSATPIFDKPSELGLTMNLLKPEVKFPVGTKFNQTFIKVKKTKTTNKITYDLKNVNKLKNLLNGYISYYKGIKNF